MKPLFQRLTVMLLIVFTLMPVFSNAASDNVTVTVQTKNKPSTYTFTRVAVDNLSMLRTIAKQMGNTNHIETLQAIMMVETRAGTGGSVGLPTAHPSRRSYGLMQLTVPTARVVFRNNPELRTEIFGDKPMSKVKNSDIIKVLLNDARTNIRLGILLFAQYFDIVNSEWARAVAGYNMGIGNAIKRKHAPQTKYVADVKKWLPVVHSLNEMTTTPVDNPDTPAENTLENKPEYKETKDGEEGKATETNTRTERDESGEQSGRAEEVQDNASDNHTLLSAD